MRHLDFVLSPLDQFEVRDLFSINANLLGNLHLSLTNIGLYLSISIFLILTYSLLATNNNKIVPELVYQQVCNKCPTFIHKMENKCIEKIFNI